MFAECDTFAAELMGTMTSRFRRLQTLAQDAPPPVVTIVGHRYDIACHQLRDFLAHNGIAFTWADPTRPDGAGALSGAKQGDRFPIVRIPGGTELVTPTLRELAEGLHLPTMPRREVYDVVVVGAGPAGLAAAVYGASEGLASGVAWRELDAPGADALVGRGIHYGAARTEAAGCAGAHVFLVGGGNSAGQAAMYFANYASRVTILVRGHSLAASMSHYLIEQLASKANIEVRTRSRIVQVHGEDRVESVAIEDRDTGELRTEPAADVFCFIGADATTDWLPAAVIRDRMGYVCTGRDVLDLVAQAQGRWPLARDPYLLEASVPGVFVAGDVRHGSVKRVASGVGEGSMAIAFIHQYLAALQPAAA